MRSKRVDYNFGCESRPRRSLSDLDSLRVNTVASSALLTIRQAGPEQADPGLTSALGQQIPAVDPYPVLPRTKTQECPSSAQRGSWGQPRSQRYSANSDHRTS